MSAFLMIARGYAGKAAVGEARTLVLMLLLQSPQNEYRLRHIPPGGYKAT
jgi:hypothetical protein